MARPPQVSIRVQYERPINLKSYTRDFIKAYVVETNKQVEANAQKFADEFLRLHESKGANVSGRRLRGVYTGYSGNSVDAEWEPLQDNITVLSGKGLLTVGYRPESARGKIYVGAIEGGWAAEQGGGTRRGSTSGLIGSGNRKTASQKKTIKPSFSQRESVQDGLLDRRLKKWAAERLGLKSITQRSPKKITARDRARYWALRKKVVEQGETGRNVVGLYTKNPKVKSQWIKINERIIKSVERSHRLTRVDKKLVSSVLVRGVGP